MANRRIVVCGDFNINLLANSPLATKFINNTELLNLCQAIRVPTRVTPTSESLLDLCIVDDSNSVVYSGTCDFGMSDHLLCYVVLKWKFAPVRKQSTVYRRSMKNFNPAEFNADLEKAPWSILETFDDPSDKTDIYNLLLSDILDLHAPLKKVKARKHNAPWITRDLRKKMIYRDRLHRKFLQTRLKADYERYKQFRNQVTKWQRSAKRDYVTELVRKKIHPSNLWSAIKVCKYNGLSPKPGTTTTPPASSLNSYFTSITSANRDVSLDSVVAPSSVAHVDTCDLPLISPTTCSALISDLKPKMSSGVDTVSTVVLRSAPETLSTPLSIIINSSITSTSFPRPWKAAIVHPLHKSGSTLACNNYRPISMLPAASKVAEMYIVDILTNHLERNNLIHPLQSGFRRGHSTQSLLLYLTDCWYKSMDMGDMVGVVYLDIAKAFDTINHTLLLHKLKVQFYLSNQMCQWIKSYLSNRAQAVSANSTVSPFLPLDSGVPQGSVLGPLLFSMYINDLPVATASPSQTALFADDTTIFASGKTVDSISSSMNAILSLVKQWLIDNGLSLNVAKTKCMLVHSKRKSPPPLHITFNESSIEQVETFKLLGVIIDQHLHWRPHIDNVVKSASRNVQLMRRLSWFLPTNALKAFYFAYIATSFDYCSLVWDTCCASDSTRLQRLQNYASRIILKLPTSSSATEALSTLHWTSLSERRQQKLLSLSQQLLQPKFGKSAPSYLRNLLTNVSDVHHYHTRGAARGHLHVNKVWREFGKKAISYRLTQLRNSN